MKTGIELIAEKRAKHQAKGWTRMHDLKHDTGILAIVAADLSLQHTDVKIHERGEEIPQWGIDLGYEHNVIDRLAIAGSLIAAEIDRLQSK